MIEAQTRELEAERDKLEAAVKKAQEEMRRPATLLRRDESKGEHEPVQVILSGRWKSDRICLDLFSTGDFELSILGQRPKVVVLGRANQTRQTATTVALELSVWQIWAARWTSPCRKSDRTGDWIDSTRALGVAFTPDKTFSLELRDSPSGGIFVCASECAYLEPDAPLLGGRWRLPPGKSLAPRGEKPGDLLALNVSVGRGASISYEDSTDTEFFPSLYGTAELVHVEADTFAMTFTLQPWSKIKPPAMILGMAIRQDAPIRLRLRRLPEQRLEVCVEDGACAQLERKFDTNSHNLR